MTLAASILLQVNAYQSVHFCAHREILHSCLTCPGILTLGGLFAAGLYLDMPQGVCRIKENTITSTISTVPVQTWAKLFPQTSCAEFGGNFCHFNCFRLQFVFKQRNDYDIFRCNSRKFLYLPHKKDFFPKPPTHLGISIKLHNFFKFFCLSEPPCNNSNTFCGESMFFFSGRRFTCIMLAIF